jgi:hypothetical protein
MRLLGALALFTGFAIAAQAQVPAITVKDGLSRLPRQPSVNVTTPTPDQAAHCKVEAIPNPNDPKSPLGYVVRDPSGNPVRQFVSYDGKNFNIVAFYVNGVEAFREVYPLQTNEPHQYRWLGVNGTKWGLDRDRDGRIDEWVVLSPEELSQELLQALQARDVKRAEALVVSKANLDALGLPAAEAQKILGRATIAAKRTIDAAESLKLTPDARWVNLQLSAPQATPADALGKTARDDLVFHKNGTLLIQDGKEGKDTKTLAIGELVQIGRAWKLVDGPGSGPIEAGPGPVIVEAIKDLVAALNKIDEQAPNPPTRESLAAYNAQRAKILEQIVPKVPAAQQELWLKQLVDSLAGAAEGEKADGPHLKRLKEIKDSLAKGPSPAAAAYAAYRHLQADHAVAIVGATNIEPVQEKWREGLEQFIKAFPNSDEAPEAILRLAMAFEYARDGEKKAKEWYAKLVKDYARFPQAAKGAGALKRLDGEGKPIELAGPNLNGQSFDIAAHKGKTVVLYYTASWSQSLADDAKKLQSLMKDYGPKGLEIVTVCLDHDPVVASRAMQTAQVPGTHLHAPGGLDGSPLAIAYGIQVVPHLIVADKTGKITNRNAQIATLEEDLKKLMP